MRTKGSVAFARMVGSAAEASGTFGVSVSTIDAWRHGRRIPGPNNRVKIFKAGGPDGGWWDVPALEPQAMGPVFDTSTIEAASPEATARIADSLQAHAQQLQHEVMAMNDGDPARRIKSVRELAGVITDLGKLTGAAILNERQIRNSPAWRTLLGVVVTALEPWPDAMRAAAEALEKREVQD